jgi:hypothetical protein
MLIAANLKEQNFIGNSFIKKESKESSPTKSKISTKISHSMSCLDLDENNADKCSNKIIDVKILF